jgi:hypothetical protein
MITVIIEKLSEGYVVEKEGKRFAVTQDRMIQKVKSLLGITHFKKKGSDNSVRQPAPEGPQRLDIIEPIKLEIKKDILKVGKLTGLGKKALSHKEDPDSVQKAPESSSPRQDRKVRDPVDWLRIEEFDWDLKKEKSFKTIFFVELDDGRVTISYSKCRYFTTKENVLKIPYPVPKNYLKFVKASNHKQAVARYREYLHLQDKKKTSSDSVRVLDSRPAPLGDRKSKEDPDRAYKPMLNGAFSTKTDYDGSKLEGTL